MQRNHLSIQPADLGEGVELGVRVCYPLKAHHNGHKLSIITETPSLAVYEPIAIQFCGGRVHQIGGGFELGGQVRYPAKVLRIWYNVFAGNETLSLSVYEPIAVQILLRRNRPQILGGGRARGSGVEPLKVIHIMYNLIAGTEMLSLSL